jgi:hypothetical protein
VLGGRILNCKESSVAQASACVGFVRAGKEKHTG